MFDSISSIVHTLSDPFFEKENNRKHPHILPIQISYFLSNMAEALSDDIEPTSNASVARASELPRSKNLIYNIH